MSLKEINGYLKSIVNLRETRLLTEKLYRKYTKIQFAFVGGASPGVSDWRTSGTWRGFNAAFSVLLGDAFHVNERNFGSLYAALAAVNATVAVGVTEDDQIALLKACGDYAAFRTVLAPHAARLPPLADADALLDLRVGTIRLFDVAVDEMLSVALTRPSAERLPVYKDRRAVAEVLLAEEPELVADCLAAALYWIDHWSRVDFRVHDVAVVFSGSYIYGRVLMEMTATSKTRCVVVESFMTGDDYFMEERYAPLSNASRIRSRNVYDALAAQPTGEDVYERQKIAAVNRIFNNNNKNVTQPAPEPLPAALKGRRLVLVLGQVVNDFSLISGCGGVLRSVPVYTRLIEDLLAADDVAVVFKAHPWEMRKKNIGRPYTEDAVRAFVETLPEEKRRRVHVVRDFNLLQLLETASHAVTLCSQSAMEAALTGLRPVVIGGAFYDRAGFTSNFDRPEDAARAIASGTLEGRLDLTGFSAFERFIALLIGRHLVPTDESGIERVLKAMRRYRRHDLAVPGQSELAIQQTWR